MKVIDEAATAGAGRKDRRIAHAHFRDVWSRGGRWACLVLSFIESIGIPNPGGTDALLLLVSIARPATRCSARCWRLSVRCWAPRSSTKSCEREASKFLVRLHVLSGRG